MRATVSVGKERARLREVQAEHNQRLRASGAVARLLGDDGLLEGRRYTVTQQPYALGRENVHGEPRLGGRVLYLHEASRCLGHLSGTQHLLGLQTLTGDFVPNPQSAALAEDVRDAAELLDALHADRSLPHLVASGQYIALSASELGLLQILDAAPITTLNK